LRRIDDGTGRESSNGTGAAVPGYTRINLISLGFFHDRNDRP